MTTPPPPYQWPKHSGVLLQWQWRHYERWLRPQLKLVWQPDYDIERTFTTIPEYEGEEAQPYAFKKQKGVVKIQELKDWFDFIKDDLRPFEQPIIIRFDGHPAENEVYLDIVFLEPKSKYTWGKHTGVATIQELKALDQYFKKLLKDRSEPEYTRISQPIPV